MLQTRSDEKDRRHLFCFFVVVLGVSLGNNNSLKKVTLGNNGQSKEKHFYPVIAA